MDVIKISDGIKQNKVIAQNFCFIGIPNRSAVFWSTIAENNQIITDVKQPKKRDGEMNS